MGKTKYRSEYPCLFQSRFEPRKRMAIDGVLWWCVWDNKKSEWSSGANFVPKSKTRRDALLKMMIRFREGDLPFEPDEEGKDLQWLRCEARGGVIRHEQKKVNCQEPLRASCTKA